MKRLLSIVGMLFAMNACSGYATGVPTPTPIPKQDPKTFSVEKNWSMTTPKGWKKATQKKPNAESKNEFLAFSPESVGRDHMILSVDSVSWSSDKDGGSRTFSLGMKEALVESFTVIKSEELVLQGQDATFVAYIIGDNVAVLQLNVAWKERGYLVICAGDLGAAATVVKTCGDALSSFKLK